MAAPPRPAVDDDDDDYWNQQKDRVLSEACKRIIWTLREDLADAVHVVPEDMINDKPAWTKEYRTIRTEPYCRRMWHGRPEWHQIAKASLFTPEYPNAIRTHFMHEDGTSELLVLGPSLGHAFVTVHDFVVIIHHYILTFKQEFLDKWSFTADDLDNVTIALKGVDCMTFVLNDPGMKTSVTGEGYRIENAGEGS